MAARTDAAATASSVERWKAGWTARRLRRHRSPSAVSRPCPVTIASDVYCTVALL
jgi:hypothetical protein